MNKRVILVIVHYGDIATTKKCIDSITKYSKIFHIIVVNNDQRVELRKSHFQKEHISIIQNRENTGFARGVNSGIKEALSLSPDYILLLNNDTWVKNDILKPLLNFAEINTDAGIIAPVIAFQKSSELLFDFGGKVNWTFGRTTHTNKTKITSLKTRRVEYASGCCMLLKKQVINKVGMFDERFFLYYEDVDYCLRAKKLGFYTFVVPSSVVFHHLSHSVGKVSTLAAYHLTKSALIFGKKYITWRILNVGFVAIQCLQFFFKNRKSGIYAFSALFTNIF